MIDYNFFQTIPREHQGLRRAERVHLDGDDQAADLDQLHGQAGTGSPDGRLRQRTRNLRIRHRVRLDP